MERYQSWVSDSEHYQVWVAKDETKNNRIIAYILCGECSLPLENCSGGPFDLQQCGEIKRLYVHPDYFGDGISRHLMELALNWLEERNRSAIFLSVWSENHRALRFYEKLGFNKAGECEFYVSKHADKDFILCLLK